VNKVAQKPDPRVPRNKRPDNRHAEKGNEGMKINCNFCGYHHEKSREKCPAWGMTCDNCKDRNHFKSKCKKVQSGSQVQNGNEDFDDQWLMAVNYKEESINASLTVNEHDLSFQLDIAANINTICQKHVRKHQVSPTTVCLNMWNKTNMKPLGETVLMVVNLRTRVKSEVKFVVVPNGFTNLLDLETIQECFISQIKAPQLCDLGEATLRIDKNAQPKVLPCRKIPLAIE